MPEKKNWLTKIKTRIHLVMVYICYCHKPKQIVTKLFLHKQVFMLICTHAKKDVCMFHVNSETSRVISTK